MRSYRRYVSFTLIRSNYIRQREKDIQLCFVTWCTCTKRLMALDTKEGVSLVWEILEPVPRIYRLYYSSTTHTNSFHIKTIHYPQGHANRYVFFYYSEYEFRMCSNHGSTRDGTLDKWKRKKRLFLLLL